MSIVSKESNAQYWEPSAVGPVAQNYPPVSAPAQIAANGDWSTGLLVSDGFKCLAIAAMTSSATTLSLQRYVDTAGLIPQGAPSTLPLVANAFGNLNITDGLPFGSYEVTIEAGGAAANVSAFIILQTAA